MRWISLCFVAVAATGRLAVAQGAASPAEVRLPDCVVALTEHQADLPPQETGVIKEIAVKPGDQVAEKQLLLQLDDRKAQKEQAVAEAKYAAAKAKADDDINVRYADAAAKVAKAEYDLNVEADNTVPGSIPKVRLSELFLKCKETELAIEKARLDRKIAGEEAKVAAAEVEAAKVMVDLHKLVSPIAGEVVDIRAHNGEAVQPNQAVIRVAKFDSLWVEARRVPAAKFARAELKGQNVTVDVAIKSGEKRSLSGKVIFVDPLTESGDTYMVRAKVDNVKLLDDWVLHPGMQVEMNIQLRKLPADAGPR